MESSRIDTLVRSLHQPRSRRNALGALLAGLLGPYLHATETRGRGKDRGKKRGKARKAVRAAQAPASCCSSGNCTPGKGKNLSKCCYEHGDVSGKNFSGANLASANFTGADAGDANFAGANLGKACLVNADLTGARINGSTNLGGVVFCRTTMPDGNVNDSGCGRGTRCCPTCIAQGQVCGDGIGGECCNGSACVDGTCVEGPPCDVCPSGCPFDNLQDAVDAADRGEIIRICPGTYRTFDVTIDKNLNIVGSGDGPGGTVLDGERRFRVLTFAPDVGAALRDLIVTRGAPDPSSGPLGSNGGGIYVESNSTLTLDTVQVTDSEGDLGGGIHVAEGSRLSVLRSSVTNNRAESFGAGIFNSGTTTLDASLVADNVTAGAGEGGGIANEEILNLTNGSQVTGNRASRGGGVQNLGQVTVSGGSTITGNTGGNCEDIGTGSGCPT